jgi:hypothetical protein
VRDVRLWRVVLGVEKMVIERVEFDEDADLMVAHVRPTSRARSRDGMCGRRRPATTLAGVGGGGGRWIWAPWGGAGRRRPTVTCTTHGVVVAEVPRQGLTLADLRAAPDQDSSHDGSGSLSCSGGSVNGNRPTRLLV